VSHPETTIPNNEECARMLLDTLPQLMRMLHGSMRKNHGEAHTFGQMRMLGMLREQPWMLTDLAARHHVAVSTMSRTVDALVERGWVARANAPGDRRKVLLSLTELGVASLDAFSEQARLTLAELMAPLNPAERSDLFAGMVVLQRLAQQSIVCAEREAN
jgi:DNA-binding MarR family transcriptional regulator